MQTEDVGQQADWISGNLSKCSNRIPIKAIAERTHIKANAIETRFLLSNTKQASANNEALQLSKRNSSKVSIWTASPNDRTEMMGTPKPIAPNAPSAAARRIVSGERIPCMDETMTTTTAKQLASAKVITAFSIYLGQKCNT